MLLLTALHQLLNHAAAETSGLNALFLQALYYGKQKVHEMPEENG